MSSSRCRCRRGRPRRFLNRLYCLWQPAFEQGREPTSKGRLVGELLAFDNSSLVQQQPRELRKLVRGANLAHCRSEPLDELVPRVELKDTFGGRVQLAVLF